MTNKNNVGTKSDGSADGNIAGLTVTLGQASTTLTGAINITNLNLVYGSSDTYTLAGGYLPLNSAAKGINLLTAISKEGTNNLNTVGINVTGSIDLTQSIGGQSAAQVFTELFKDNTVNVLTIGNSSGQNVAVTNSTNPVNVTFSSTGTNVRGLKVEGTGSTWTGKVAETYDVTAVVTKNNTLATGANNVSLFAMAVDVRGQGNWESGLTATATGAAAADQNEYIVDAYALTVGYGGETASTVNLSGPTKLTATSSQGSAVGLFAGSGKNPLGTPSVTISGPSLEIYTNANAGEGKYSPSGPLPSAFSAGIQIAGTQTGDSLVISSENISITSLSKGNDSMYSAALGIQVVNTSDAIFQIGTDDTKTIDINTSITPSEKEGTTGNNMDVATGVAVPGGTAVIGGENTKTTISAGYNETPDSNWKGKITGILVNGTSGSSVTLKGEGTVSAQEVPNNTQAFVNAINVGVSKDGSGEAGLTVEGTWKTVGDVTVGNLEEESVNGKSTLNVQGGSLSVDGNLIVNDSNASNSVSVGSSGNLDVSETVTNEGTFTVDATSTAAVNGANPENGAAFSNTGTLNVNGSLTVADTLANSGENGSVLVGEGATLTVNDLENTSTKADQAFETSPGSTLVVNGVINPGTDDAPGALTGAKAVTVNGTLVTDASNLYGTGNTQTANTFTVTGAEALALAGSLTPEQAQNLRQQAVNARIALTEGVDFEGSTEYSTPAAQQNFYKGIGSGALDFTYKQSYTAEKPAQYLKNLVVGAVPPTSPTGALNQAYIDSFYPDKKAQFDRWQSGMVMGSIDLGTGSEIFVSDGKTLQIGGLKGVLVTNNGNAAPHIVVYQTGSELLIGSENGGSSAEAPTLTVDVLGGTMTVQGNVADPKALSYTIGTINLGNAYIPAATPTPAVAGTSGILSVSDVTLTVDTLTANVNTSNGKSTSSQGSQITVTNGTLNVNNALSLNGLNAIGQGEAANNPIDIALNNGTLNSTAGLTASFIDITGTGESTLNVGSAPLSLTSSDVDMATATITAGSIALTDTGISVDEGTVAITGVADLTKGSSISLGEGSISLGGTTISDSSLSVGTGSITLGDTQMAGGSIEVENGDLTIGTLEIAASTTSKNPSISVTNGNLTTGDAAIGSGADVTVTAGPTASVSMGTVRLAGNLAVYASEDATTLTPVALAGMTFNAESGSFIAGPQLAVQLGNANVQGAITSLKKHYPTAQFTNVLATASSIEIGENNTFAIGVPQGTTAVTDDLTIGGTTPGIVANLQNLTGDSLFTSMEGSEPTVSIAPGALFLVANPIGDKTYTIVDDGFVTTGIDLSENDIQSTNPLYEVSWLVQDEEPAAAAARDAAAPNPTSFVVAINATKVRNELNTIAPEALINASQLGYNPNQAANEGGNLLLNIIADITDPSQYPEKAALINSIALRGAAAHAHEIGISAASMVIDSVWDHTSKLAAAPHEQAKADLWITLDWNHSRANDYKAAGLDNGYKLDLYGATFGADYDFANGLAAGLAVSVGGGEAKSKGYNAGQKTDVTYWGINLYGTYTSPIVNVIGNVGYIGIKNKTKVNGDKGRPDANIWTIGVKAEKDFAINEQFTVTPHVGIRYLSVDVDDFNLQGFHYGTDRANLVQFPIGVAFAANLKTANGAAVKPFLDLSFVPTAGDKKVDNTFGITGGSARDVIDTTIASTSMFQGKIGVNASYGAHNFGLNFAIGGGNKGRLDTGLQAKYRFVF